MTFHVDSIVHLMGLLTTLYADPELAIIREYSTNALDSHRQAGVGLPIEIVLPSQFERTFIVRDFGLGMSEEELTDNYSEYGFSSKRETNEATGMLGVGGKSALAYTN